MAESSGLVLLSLTVPPRLEESIIDWLLGTEECQGFTSFPVHGHSSRPKGLTLSEQVSGRKGNVRFELCLPSAQADELIEDLRQRFPGAGMTYWVTPASRFGRIDANPGITG